jgi:UDP-4-amino-4,6-dideoxy-N-acetyl-beta-L-altrosamine transaminase
MIPYGRQDIRETDVEAVLNALTSEYLTQGPLVPQFESAVAKHVGAKYSVAVNSATSALHIACLALGLNRGDWLWTSPITFVASANCGLYCGAKVDFVDIDPKSYNICPAALEKKLVQAQIKNRLPKILVAVHLCGQSCDMEPIYKLGQIYGFKVIEDASHAIGGKYKEEYVGCGKYSHITVFSFHPVKIITTGEGGMAVTNCGKLASKLALLRSHGITRDVSQMTKISDGPWYYQQIELGYNYRMTELQAALGLSQIKRLDEYVAKRHDLFHRYNNLLTSVPVIKPWQHPDTYSAMHLYVIQLDGSKVQKSHRQVFEELREQKVGVNLHYIPVHTQPFYARMGFKVGDFPISEAYYASAISLPMYQTLSYEEQDHVILSLKTALCV